MTAESRRTSFFALTDDDQPDDGVAIRRIEIPQFQRDYAQGRDSNPVRRIRTDFLDALLAAIVGDDAAAVGLDFVYGAVDEGTLRPLDGQQRLTTLFLLHWYIASRCDHLDEGHGWKRFSYATRQSARMFCESLADHRLPDGTGVPSAWVKDQAWYLFLWRHDPTIRSMLVMIDAIHERFREIDAAAAWARLTDADDPAIWFLLLPLSGLSSGGQDMRPEDLYIKMNSRGKPLTEFESFKAHFEKTIESSPRCGEFALKVDTEWSDLLWHLRGDDDLVDDEFLRYLEFITEVCEWRDGRDNGAGKRLDPRTRAIFGEGNPQHGAHLDFLFRAFDIWVRHPIIETFDGLFATSAASSGEISKVRLFFRNEGNPQEPLNLLEACCRSFGETRGRARVFSLGQSLMLYAVVLHLIEDTADFPRRIRILRNLVEASSDELRPERMPKILDDVHGIVLHGDVGGVGTLNQAQVTDETLKAAFLSENPDLERAVFALEDHELLRGSLGAFELDAASFESRAAVFDRLMSQPHLWPDLLGSLLAVGEYQRQRPGARPFLFGTDSKRHDSAWRALLTGATRDGLRPTRVTLAAFLDRVAESSTSVGDTMQAINREYLARCESEQRFDWRYYMVKYPSMREKGSSIYYAERAEDAEQPVMGYSLCMLQAGGRALNGNYRDPYLLAIGRELDDSGIVEDKWFTGYETQPRRLPLTRSGAALRCATAGFELSPPPTDADAEAFATASADLEVDADQIVVVPQVEVDGRRVDTVDRVQLGADVLRRLAALGL